MSDSVGSLTPLIMKRRELLILAATAPACAPNAIYGKFCGGRVIHNTDSTITLTDIKSEYPWTLRQKV